MWGLAGIAVAGGIAPAVAGTPAACGQQVPAFWQITLTRSDMPFTFTDAFRLHDGGTLEFASWSSQLRVEGVAGPVRLSEGAARSFRALAERRHASARSADIAGRAAEGLEAGAFTPAGAVHSATDTIPDEARAFLADLKARLPVTAPAPGIYAWTKPVAFSPVVDLDLNPGQGDCDGAVARAVVEGLTVPRLLAPVASGAERYLAGDLSARTEFVAKLGSGFAAFGIVRA